MITDIPTGPKAGKETDNSPDRIPSKQLYVLPETKSETEKVFSLFNPGKGDIAPLTITDIPTGPKAGQETEHSPDEIHSKELDVPPETKCKTEQDVELVTEASPLLKPTPSEMVSDSDSDL